MRVREGHDVFLEKTCPDHGFFRTLIWAGPPDYDEWGNDLERRPFDEAEFGNCPNACGLCRSHLQRSCCVLLELTARCNLRCPICFASAGGEDAPPDPTLGEIAEWYELLREKAGTVNIQLSGGEPTIRDDLPRIIRMGREYSFSFFQLNTNGLRLAEEPAYAASLKQAGLSCVFLQFDGVSEDTYIKLRGQPLLEKKLRAIENCAASGLGVVLVPTLLEEVNLGELGGLFNFMLERLPAVRGLHLQPAAFFGRYPGGPERRLTLPRVLRELEIQTGGRIRAEHFRGGTAESAHCSFHGNFYLLSNGKVSSLAAGAGGCCSPGEDAVSRAQAQVARRWSAAPESGNCEEPEEGSLDAFLLRMRNRSFSVSAMAFQDVWSLDLERLRKCYIHVVGPRRTLVPFCAYNVSSVDGATLYRGNEKFMTSGPG